MISNLRTNKGQHRRWVLLTTLLAVLALMVAKQQTAPLASVKTNSIANLAAHRANAKAHGTTPPPRRFSRTTHSVIVRHLTPVSPVPAKPTSGLTAPIPPRVITTSNQRPNPYKSVGTTVPSAFVASPAPRLDRSVVETGWLAGPNLVSASYPLTLGSVQSGVLTWSSGASLSLSVSCPSGSTAMSATSTITLSVGPGSCRITVSGPDNVVATSYHLTIGAR